MTPLPPPVDALEMARRARAKARSNFISTVEQGQHVREVTERIEKHIRENHFGEGLDREWRRRWHL